VAGRPKECGLVLVEVLKLGIAHLLKAAAAPLAASIPNLLALRIAIGIPLIIAELGLSNQGFLHNAKAWGRVAALRHRAMRCTAKASRGLVKLEDAHWVGSTHSYAPR